MESVAPAFFPPTPPRPRRPATTSPGEAAAPADDAQGAFGLDPAPAAASVSPTLDQPPELGLGVLLAMGHSRRVNDVGGALDFLEASAVPPPPSPPPPPSDPFFDAVDVLAALGFDRNAAAGALQAFGDAARAAYVPRRPTPLLPLTRSFHPRDWLADSAVRRQMKPQRIGMGVCQWDLEDSLLCRLVTHDASHGALASFSSFLAGRASRPATEEVVSMGTSHHRRALVLWGVSAILQVTAPAWGNFEIVHDAGVPDRLPTDGAADEDRDAWDNSVADLNDRVLGKQWFFQQYLDECGTAVFQAVGDMVGAPPDLRAGRVVGISVSPNGEW